MHSDSRETNSNHPYRYVQAVFDTSMTALKKSLRIETLGYFRGAIFHRGRCEIDVIRLPNPACERYCGAPSVLAIRELSPNRSGKLSIEYRNHPKGPHA